MEPKVKRKQAEGVREHLSVQLARFGFKRTKPTFWTRGDQVIVQFVHLHLLTFTSGFRVHLGLRVLNDTFPAPALNGPMSHDSWAVASRKYVFEFSKTQDSVEYCADELAGYITETGLPWFDCFGSAQGALSPSGPLSEESRVRLWLALDGNADATAIAASRAMLGIPT